jgi:phosphate-selective porin OprO/OprP
MGSGTNRHAGPPAQAAVTLGLLAALLGGSLARAQGPPLPEANPGPPPVASTREAELEARVRQLEAMVQQLSRQMQAIPPTPAPASVAAPLPGSVPRSGGLPIGDAEAAADEELNRGGSAGLDPTAPAPAAKYNMPPAPRERKGKFGFGNGFELKSDDDEFVLQFHNLTQFDGRFYESPGTEVSRNTFGFPRVWFIFSGRLTKPLEYYLAVNEGFENLNLLDAYLNIHPRDEIQVKIGRYKTPFTYEFYSLPIQGLISPERSMFFNNYGLNRDLGIMVWGQLFDKKAEYATGIFNSNRNGFLNQNNNPAVAALVDARPFAFFGSETFDNLHVGGSVAFAQELNPPVPNVLRTNVPTVGPLSVSVPFLQFNPNVIGSGGLALWDLHAAWYYRQLSLIAEWQSGYETYAFTNNPEGSRTPIPVQSYYIQAGYFLTGETVQSRNVVEPLRPFTLKPGQWGPGAVELTARYNELRLGERVFTAGLADPRLWSNQAQLIDVGVNWTWTRNIKFYMGWQHALFGDPVQLRANPEQLQLTSDMFWFRTQIFF